MTRKEIAKRLEEFVNQFQDILRGGGVVIQNGPIYTFGEGYEVNTQSMSIRKCGEWELNLKEQQALCFIRFKEELLLMVTAILTSDLGSAARKMAVAIKEDLEHAEKYDLLEEIAFAINGLKDEEWQEMKNAIVDVIYR